MPHWNRFRVNPLSFAVAGLCIPPTSHAAQGAAPLEEVVVTAQKMRGTIEAERSMTPGGVTVVDGDDLSRRSVTHLADVLRYIPGVWSESSSGGDELFFSSRGSNLDATDYDKNGVKLLQDGLPITTADGNNHNRVLDPLSARYAVVARGANALTYGASNLGGAIDFVSPTARTSEPLAVYLTGGSHGLLSGRVTAGGVADALDGLIVLEAKSWEGYREHTAQVRKGIYANAGWQVSDAVTTRVFATFVDNDEQLPAGLTQAQLAADRNQAGSGAVSGDRKKAVETARIAFKTTWQIDESSSLQIGGSYEEQSLYHPIVDVRGDPDGPGPLAEIQYFSLLIDTDHYNVGGTARFNTKLAAHDLLLGLDYGGSRVTGGNYRNLYGRPNGLTEGTRELADNLEAFAIDRWRTGDAVTVVYGAQFVATSRDVRVVDAATGAVRNPRADYSSVNPRIGLIYRFGDTASEAYANVSRLFEAPTTFELTDDLRQNDQTLAPMQGTVVEVGVRGSTSQATSTRWQWDVAMYYAKIEDEILSVDDPLAPGTSLSTNVDGAIHAGVEALVGASFALSGETHRLEPRVSLTWNDFTFASDRVYGDNVLPAAPEYAARGELIYRHESGFYIGPTFDFIGRRYVDFANTYTVDAYELLGLRGGFSGKRWELFGEVRNLLDDDYIATFGVVNRSSVDDQNLYPGAPLSAYVGTRWAF